MIFPRMPLKNPVRGMDVTADKQPTTARNFERAKCKVARDVYFINHFPPPSPFNLAFQSQSPLPNSMKSSLRIAQLGSSPLLYPLLKS